MSSKNNLYIKFIRFITTIAILGGIFLKTNNGFAQSNPTWSEPRTIPGLVDTGINPIIVSDSEGTIHIFNSQRIAGEVNIFYSRWSLDNGWSRFVDIITSPIEDAYVLSAKLDSKGWIHLTFWGGNEIRANLYYTKAPATKADKSTAWIKPIRIGDSALNPPAGALAIDSRGDLTAVYSSNLRGNGLYMTKSEDDGNSWSFPQSIFITYDNQVWPTAFKFFTDNDGKVYATWSVADASGNGQAIYFSKEDSYSQQWSSPMVIAKAIGFEADTPSIIKYNQELILIYHNNSPSTRWMRTSIDDGETWSQPTRLFKQVGSNGAASMVIDSNNDLHMFFGNRIDATATHGAWHSRWLGDQWSKPEAIISGPQIAQGPNDREGFDPSFLQATIRQGNILFVLWRHDPVAGPRNIWYSYQLIDAPELPKNPLPTIQLVTPTTTVIPIKTQIPDSELIPTSDRFNPPYQDVSPKPDNQANNSNTIILISAVPIALLLISIGIIQIRRNR